MTSFLNDFECQGHGVFEAWGNTFACPTCGAVLKPLIGSKGILLNFKDPGFKRCYRVWADEHERNARPPEKRVQIAMPRGGKTWQN